MRDASECKRGLAFSMCAGHALLSDRHGKRPTTCRKRRSLHLRQGAAARVDVVGGNITGTEIGHVNEAPVGSIATPVGLAPVANGEPFTGVRAPLSELIRYAETLLE